MHTPARTMLVLLAVSAFLFAAGCDSMYYGAWEKLGYAKRDLLVDSVRDARDGQQRAKEQFESALEKFSSVVGVEGGRVEAKYDELKAELEESEARAQAVHERVEEVEEVSEDLFDEWESELDQYESSELRRLSERRLRETRRRYDDLIGSMRRAESKMEPVLALYQDQVLFLKHNLNARAIASLQTTADKLRTDVRELTREMQASIEEADAFLDSLDQP